MSKIALNSNASGTGVFTIASPNSDTDRTLTLPDEAGTLLTTTGDGSGLTGISSYADSDALDLFNASGSAPVYACRAWVNFNGTGTVAIRASGNVSSITDNGTGDYTVNFSTALLDANFSVGITGRYGSGSSDIAAQLSLIRQSTPQGTGFVRVLGRDGSNSTNADIETYCVSVFR